MSGFVDAYSSLTSISFVGHDGDVQPSGFQGTEITRPGVSGKSVILTGYVGEPFQIMTRAVVNGASLAAALQILYTQYKQHLVTFTDDQGNAWANILVLDVQGISVKKYFSGVGLASGSTHMVTATWTLQSVATGY